MFNSGVLREEIPGPGERIRGGFVAGKEEGHDLVAELNVAHARAMLVVSVEKGLQQVVRGPGGSAAIANDGENHAIQVAARTKQARRFRKGKAVGDKERKRGLREETLHDGGNFRANGPRVVRELGAEKGFRDDVQGQFGHLLVKVAGLLVAPTGKMRRSGTGHYLRIGGDIFVAEGRLDELPLPLPRGAVVGEEAIA